MLGSLAEALKASEFHEDIEILIQDNGSADETQFVIERSLRSFSTIEVRFEMNAKNLGLDGNFLCLMRRATGDYILFLSDDDVVCPAGLNELVRTLESTRPGFVLTNRTNLRDGIHSDGLRRFDWSAAKSIDWKEAVEILGTELTFMSVIVYQRKFIDIEKLTEYDGTLLVISRAFLQGITGGRYGIRLPEPILMYRLASSGGYSRFRVFLVEFERVICQARDEGLSSRSYHAIIRSHLWHYMVGAAIEARLKPNDYSYEANLHVVRMVLKVTKANLLTLWYSSKLLSVLCAPKVLVIALARRREKIYRERIDVA